jgi:hypothetical protein
MVPPPLPINLYSPLAYLLASFWRKVSTDTPITWRCVASLLSGSASYSLCGFVSPKVVEMFGAPGFKAEEVKSPDRPD